jgi:hypothetical protein
MHPPLTDADADERMDDAFRHRPAGQRHLGVETLRIAFADERTILDDDDGAGLDFLIRQSGFDRRLEGIPIESLLAILSRCLPWWGWAPGFAGMAGLLSQFIHRPVDGQRAAESLAKHGRAVHAERACGDGLRVTIDLDRQKKAKRLLQKPVRRKLLLVDRLQTAPGDENRRSYDLCRKPSARFQKPLGHERRGAPQPAAQCAESDRTAEQDGSFAAGPGTKSGGASHGRVHCVRRHGDTHAALPGAS